MEVLSRYDVRRELGRGGMGVVYEAYDVRLQRTVALKVLSGAARDPQQRGRIEHEARAASALNHPNIVTIHDIISTTDSDLIVMEYVDGDALSTRLAAESMTFDNALHIATQIASALAAAHAAGIVHRDLKPGNVMVTRDDRVKVVDFGLSKLIRTAEAAPDITTRTRSQSESSVVMGTAGYLSPEQACGDHVDARSDIFSFGVVLYEMLAGRRAFPGDSLGASWRAVLEQQPTSLERVRPGLPSGVTELVARCLEKDRNRRHESGAELHAALLRLAARAPAVVLSRARRRRIVYVLASMTFIVSLASAVPLYRSYALRLRAAAVQEIEGDIDEGRYARAYVLARELEQRAPTDPDVRRVMQKVSYPASVVTEPGGATISFKDYGDRTGSWHLLGVSPITTTRPPVGVLHWRVAKEGFEPVEGRFQWGQRSVHLHPVATRPKGMVYVSGGVPVLSAVEGLVLPAYWIDKYEVTNADFQAFIDAGGYRDPRWWKHEFINAGRMLTWAEAMRFFVDRTGRPGPAYWEAGTYPTGRANYPVSGVSWYEAAAFAEFSNKSLPTVYQWQLACERGDIRLANFGAGAAPVSALDDLGAYGTYGLAGNVKEWAWNGVDAQRYIMGGSWNEPPYMATEPDARPPFDRAETHGIRLVKHITPPAEFTIADVRILPKHVLPQPPASDEVFEAYRRFYAYEKSPLDATFEEATATNAWREERVSIAAAYGKERVTIHLLLPHNSVPPYQTVIWCPGSYSLRLDADARMTVSYYFDFLVKSGRAVVLVDFQGMYGRRSTHPATVQRPDALSERIIHSAKDLSRAIDYLETRSDIDSGRVAFYIYSFGPQFLAAVGMEPRLKSLILLSAGLPRRRLPPEIDPVNIAPRIRMPVLLLAGRYDYMYPVDASQKPLFDRLGTAANAKKHVIFESGHAPERIAVTREVLEWLDQTLGVVNTR
jgi:predicted Ser/Thr protein kinase/dienelactone hydrolase